jgi:hypothetical protein
MRQPARPKAVFNKVEYLASTLANQRNDRYLALRDPRQHTHQRALADAGAAEYAHPLALADR